MGTESEAKLERLLTRFESIVERLARLEHDVSTGGGGVRVVQLDGQVQQLDARLSTAEERLDTLRLAGAGDRTRWGTVTWLAVAVGGAAVSALGSWILAH